MKTIARTRKIGGSIMITVPKEIVREEALTEGQLIEITIEKAQKSFFGVAKGISSLKEEDKFKGQLEDG